MRTLKTHLLLVMICAMTICNASPSFALDVLFQPSNPPLTKPARDVGERAKLVDGNSTTSWSGGRKNTLTFTLDQSELVKGVILTPAKNFSTQSIRILLSSDGVNFTETRTVKNLTLKRGIDTEIGGFQGQAQAARVIVKAKKKKSVTRRKSSRLALAEVFLVKDDGGSQPGQPTPTPTTTPTPGPTPTPTPGATPAQYQFDTLERISIGSGGGESGVDSLHPSVSNDGRYVVFSTRTQGFIPGNNQAVTTVFIRDRQLNTIEVISKNNTGTPQFATEPSISGDGRYVTFRSSSNDLVAGDNNGNVADIILYDRTLDSFSLVSSTQNGTQNTGFCGSAKISQNGRYVAFTCDDTVLDPGDNNGFFDVYVKDLQSGAVELVSRSSAGIISNDDCFTPSVSDSGRYVAWDSRATNLVANDTNATSDVFLRDRQNNLTLFGSSDSSGNQANDESDTAEISANGEYLVYQSFATNLVPGSTNRAIYRQRVSDRSLMLISADQNGVANSENYRPTISDNGRFVAFQSNSDNLVPGDNNGEMDAFIFDTAHGTTILVSRTAAGIIGDFGSPGGMGGIMKISGDGLTLVFPTSATNLFASVDSNFTIDIAAADLRPMP